MIRRLHELAEKSGENIRQGHGLAHSRLLLSAQDGCPFQALAFNRLPPGSSWGPKTQDKTAEFFLILSGQAEVLDQGQRALLHPGDILLAKNGEMLAIRNPGPAELTFVACLYKDQAPGPLAALLGRPRS
ncbi:MAG: cupin domain-containing protein [Blastochloris sp.]|nr:cupin domain-containing protein [Blastochloris sp.]